jgi:release factor glutamine methyltransferase
VTTWAALLRDAAARLRDAGVDEPMRDARALLAHAAAIPPDRLTLHLHDATSADAARLFDALIARRTTREPVWRIIGHRDFFGRRFRITPDVLDPRPETEILVAEALAHPFDSVLDLGTGSGCILLTLLAERPLARGLGTDLSPAALCVAQGNACALAPDRARFVLSDWFSQVEGRFGLIVSNPPYIAADEMPALAPEVANWDPAMALTPGGDGLAPYRAIAAKARDHLQPGGRLIVEIGPTQAAAVRQYFVEAGLVNLSVGQDLDGRDRIVQGQAP